ncbi:cilia- and flagella-associated protein 69-like [Rhynchophorus ferrugineus]|uniref:cilia- and flagella-associated protein 69-like n=1 Tax=Rhynchophorus ferrugineus TaxID=354439 RepID=UPI003FCE5DCC
MTVTGLEIQRSLDIYILKEKVKEEPLYNNILHKFIDRFSIPPILMKSSDVLTYSVDLQQYFSWLGFLLIWTEDSSMQMKIIEAIYILLTVDYSEYRNYLRLEVRKQKAENSLLAETIGEYVEVCNDDVYNELLKIILVLCSDSKVACQKFLMKSTVTSIITRFEPTWRERFPKVKPDLPMGTEVVLNTTTICQILNLLLDNATVDNMKAPTKYALWSLHWAFRLFCLREATHVQRNNILATLLLLMNVYPDVLSGNLTFCYDIAMLAMSRDVIFNPNWTSDIILTPSKEDMCFMALLLMCISYFRNLLTGPKVLEECRVVMGLLKLLGNQQTIKWKSLQSKYLISLALNILHNIVPISTEEFVEDGGPLVILELIKETRKFITTVKYQIILRSIEVLCNLCCKSKSIRNSVAYNGGFCVILSLCEEQLQIKYFSKNHQVLFAIGVCLLGQICQSDEAIQLLPMVLKFMKRYIKPNFEDPTLNPKIILLILSLIWNKFTCSFELSSEFVSHGGVYLLLDVIQMSCLPIKIVGLGVLVDLCEIVECVPYLITWRKNGQGIRSLLMDIFRQENNVLSVKVDSNGVIKDPLLPIMGRIQFYETYCPCQKFGGNPSIADMLISSRPKIYCLLQILNVKQKETVDIADEFYRLYNEELSGLDQVTLLVAENFLALKLSEEWHELEKEFEKHNIEVIPSDKAIIEAMLDITNKWGAILQQMQLDMLDKYEQKNKESETELYSKLRNTRFSETWDAIKQMGYIARCSERLFRLSTYYDQQMKIDESLHYSDENGQIHRTNLHDLPINSIKNIHIAIPPDVVEDVVESLIPTFVSPASSLFGVEDFIIGDGNATQSLFSYDSEMADE